MAETQRLRNISKVTSNAQWENDTDARLAAARQKQHLDNLEGKARSDLNSRRHQLAQLYEYELQLWKRTLEANKETPEDRKMKIKARAMQLKAHRQQEQADFVEAKRRQQWRDSCDDLRQMDSQLTLNDVAERRKEQLNEKNRQQLQDIEDENQWSNAWEVDRLRKEQRERTDLAMQHKRNEDMRRDLDMQCQQSKEVRDLLEETRQNESAETMERWNLEKRIQDEHEMKVRQANRAEGRNVREYNNARQQIRSQKAKEDMQNDLVLLQVALEKERQELEDEEEKKRQEKATTKIYQDHLRQQMVKEKADDSLYEELRRQDEAAAAGKRDAQYEREQTARAELTKAVYDGRAEQMRAKQTKMQQQIEEERLYARSQKSEAERLDALDKDMKSFQQSKRFQNRDAVKLQVAGRQRVEQRRQQEEYLQLKTMQYGEKQYQMQVAKATKW